jgi:hypothetical protein
MQKHTVVFTFLTFTYHMVFTFPREQEVFMSMVFFREERRPCNI